MIDNKKTVREGLNIGLHTYSTAYGIENKTIIRALAALNNLTEKWIVEPTGNAAAAPLIHRTEDKDGHKVVILSEWYYEELILKGEDDD